MNRAWIWASICAAMASTLLCVHHAEAQRRARWAAPVEPVLVSTSEGPSSRYQVAIGLRMLGDAEVVTDARYFSLEVAEHVEPVAGRRARRARVHRCSMGRPPRTSGAPTVMHAGDVWGVALDLRALCWGRALSAIEGGGTVTVRYAASGRSFVARALASEEVPSVGSATRRRGADTAREIEAVSPFALPVGGGETASEGITLAPIDAASGRAITLRVAVFGPDARTRRAWVRPDRVRFVVVDPRGRTWDCRMPRTGGAAIPDLFSRVSARRAVRFALDASAYCPGAFRQAGVYEVTPLVELDEDGAEWELDAVTGTFVGRTTPVRVRNGEGALVRPLSTEDLRRLFR